MYGTTFYDHIPLRFDLRFDAVTVGSSSDEVVGDLRFVPWNRLRDDELHVYKCYLEDMSDFGLTDLVDCDLAFCSDNDHRKKLDYCYDKLVNSIVMASDFLLISRSGKNYRCVPGWNEYCKHLYSISRDPYLGWIASGRLRVGDSFDEMRESRKRFKEALKFCRDNELKQRRKRLADAFRLKNKCSFWKEVKKLNINKTKSSQFIDGKSAIDEIIEVFSGKYRRILDDPLSQTSPENFDSDCKESMTSVALGRTGSCPVFRHVIDESINSLNTALGWDYIHSNHLKFSGVKFRTLLAKIFSLFITHGYTPKSFLRGEIRPILKNSFGSKSDSSNYRPVMNSSNLFKTFEYCIQPHLKSNLRINSRQFAYKKNVGCMTAASLLKETVCRYNKLKTNVHCCLVDLSKAYDRINIKTLVSKLLTTNVPPQIVNLLRFMYENTFMKMKMNENIYSSNIWDI